MKETAGEGGIRVQGHIYCRKFGLCPVGLLLGKQLKISFWKNYSDKQTFLLDVN